MDKNITYKRAKSWIEKNARPLDYLRWNYHFENGELAPVLTALASYQNEDGGFGHALEPDYWNTNSSPMQTWQAVEIIYELAIEEAHHPVIQGILRYLESEKDFFHNRWVYSIPSNNDYAHAPW